MGSRVQVILSDEEREAFRAQAKREGKSLSAWLRDAGRERLQARAQPRFKTIEDLRAFFDSLADSASDEREPDWEEHLAVIEASRATGRAPT